MPSATGLYIGLMSGTSLDGVDAVLVDFTASGASRLTVVAHQSRPFSDELRMELLALNSPGANEIQRGALAGNAVAVGYADAVVELLRSASTGPDAVAAIGAHGQTVRHRPGEFDGTGFTVQLNNPSLLAELTGIDVVADFRSRDVAAGGQGAPLVPAFHRAVFGHPTAATAVLNLGGIANLTLLQFDGATGGFDCGPANALMDIWIRRHRGQAFDAGGAWAATGQCNPTLLEAMLSEPFFSMPAPKSTGRDLFNADWLDGQLRVVANARSLPAEDIAATLAELTARSVTDALHGAMPHATELLVCGGGSLNGYLMQRIAALLPGIDVMPTDTRGLPAMQVEATAFAWLAKAFVERQPGNLSAVTGAHGPRVLGALYPA